MAGLGYGLIFYKKSGLVPTEKDAQLFQVLFCCRHATLNRSPKGIKWSAGLSDCIGYWYWVYNILVYWVFPIHVVYFVILPIQYNTIQYYKKADLRKVKYMRERLKEIRRKSKSTPRSEREQKK